MKIFDSQTIKEIDRATCEAQGIDSVELMERAANAVSCEVISRFLPSKRIIVMAGPGNNGGDALATARMLIEQGYRRVEIFLFNIGGGLSHDCDIERQRLIRIDGVDFTEVTQEFRPPYIGKEDVVIDGLFGSGLHHPLRGGFRSVADLINTSGAFVISIDVPSGLFGEWNNRVNRRDMVHADLTLTFQTPRLSFFFEENQDVVGEWKLLDIELDEQKIRETPAKFIMVEASTVRSHLRPRRKFSGKRDYGSLLIMAGSMGMMGAAVMSARAALESGAGLVTVHSARCGMNILQTSLPEAMFESDKNEFYISDMSVHYDHQAVAVGPGIRTHEDTINALEHLLQNVKCPLVIDADALNCISKRPILLSMIPPMSVLTPHIGEFDRLFGEHDSSEERLLKAIEEAKRYNVIIVLKGHHTATVRPDGRVYMNITGNPGMATAGAGDTLTGIIAAFIAQGYKPEIAATAGVFIHGLAGDLAVLEKGEYGLMASDISAKVGTAIHYLIEGKVPPTV